MKKLVIRNLGPLGEVDVQLNRLNIIVGPQSSGKSCVLKTACYCTWVEKRIELAQDASPFAKDDYFINRLVTFHKLQGHVRQDTYIEYESDYMFFSFDNAKPQDKFHFAWKKARWEYLRPQVTYIPAERNIVAVIPNWFDVKFADDNIRNFMSDWETARSSTPDNLSVLNLDVSYRYDTGSRADKIQLSDGRELDFTNASSGLQSLVPLYVHLNHLYKSQKVNSADKSVTKQRETEELLRMILQKFLRETPVAYDDTILDNLNRVEITAKSITTIRHFLNAQYCDIFLEEPEENLFPSTQTQLVGWMLDKVDENPLGRLSIATHSPYVVTSFIEKQRNDLTLFFTYLKNGMAYVKTASEAELQEIYENGVDVFFNLESYI